MFSKLFKILTVGLLLVPSVSFSYEPTTTHAGLSQEIVDFYNRFSYPKITNDEKALIIDGSVEEDNPSERALNHFYDPVRNIGFNNFPTAKKWASGEILANKHSWKDAIDAYARGDEKYAFTALGHIIHLTEDMGVPDHTRNDPHKGDGMGGLFTNHSPYEHWTNIHKDKNTLRGLYQKLINEGLVLKKWGNLDESFDFLANYSNRNFFSKDTIDGKVFKYHEPMVEEINGKYAIGIDKLENRKVKLFISTKNNKGENITGMILDGDDSVLSEYFDRLSRQIIPTGAGVIELFFKEAKIAREKYQKEQLEQQAKEDQKNKILAESFQKFNQGGILDKTKYLTQYAWNYTIKEGASVVKKEMSKIAEGPITLVQQGANWSGAVSFTGTNLTKIAAVSTKEAVDDGIEKTKNATEFIQKKNPLVLAVGPALVLENQLKKDDNKKDKVNPTIVNQIFDEKKPTLMQNTFPIGTGGFGGGGIIINQQPTFDEQKPEVTTTEEIIATTTEEIFVDTLPPDITASAIDCLHTLVVGSCVIGTSTTTLTWLSNATDTVHYAISLNDILSSTSTETEAELQLIEGNNSIVVLAYDVAGNAGTSSELIIEYIKMPIVISEIAWAGTASSTFNEWIEIYNQTGYTISLEGVSINSLDGTPNIGITGTISPNSYYLIERTDDNSVPGITADLVTAFSGSSSGSGGLGNNGEVLQLIHTMNSRSVILDSTPPLDPEDCNGWCFGNSTSFSTMARTNLNRDGFDGSNWASDSTVQQSILAETGVTIKGTPKSAYVPLIPDMVLPEF